uniref:Uncharacterized protein n=1 Tax=Ditylenchus dipsaci TaxID=166011 RepID=A0A915EC23_9BILA
MGQKQSKSTGGGKASEFDLIIIGSIQTGLPGHLAKDSTSTSSGIHNESKDIWYDCSDTFGSIQSFPLGGLNPFQISGVSPLMRSTFLWVQDKEPHTGTIEGSADLKREWPEVGLYQRGFTCRRLLQVEFYSIMSKRLHQSVFLKTPKWACLEPRSEYVHKEAAESDEEDDDTLKALQEMTRSTGKYITKSKRLSKLHLSTNKLRDITVGHNKTGAIRAVKFHPAKPVLVTGSESGIVTLFEICDENSNLELKKGENFLQDVSFKDFRISSIDFLDNGATLLAHSRQKNYSYSYDMVEMSDYRDARKVTQVYVPKAFRELSSSKVSLSADGIFVAHLLGKTDLLVFALKTMEHIATFRANQCLVDFQFSPFERNIIYGIAENGGVYTWDVRNQADNFHFMDDGCVRSTCVAVSNNGQFLACGSNTGIINIYDLPSAMTSSSPKLLYTLENLTTSASFMSFNHSSELLAFASTSKFMAGRMMHSQSGEVYQNFPTRQEMAVKERLTACHFSPSSAFFVYGKESGSVSLYRLNHFDVY